MAGAQKNLIRVYGADAHNLKDVDCAIPHGSMVGVIGVSGAGKSSLLFSVISAESEARHQALLAEPTRKTRKARARARMIDGLPFCVTVSQRSLHGSQRSTAGTQSGLHYDVVALFEQAGEIYNANNNLIRPPDAESLLQWIRRQPKVVRIQIGVLIDWRGGSDLRRIAKDAKHFFVCREGIWRVARSKDAFALSKKDAEFVALVVGAGSPKSRSELQERLQHAEQDPRRIGYLLFGIASGAAETLQKSIWQLNTIEAVPCGETGAVFPKPNRSLFSFNAAPERSLRCGECAGLGTVSDLNPGALIADPTRSIFDGALQFEIDAKGVFRHTGVRANALRGLYKLLGVTEKTSWNKLSPKAQETVFLGVEKRVQQLDANGRKTGAPVRFHGFMNALRKAANGTGAAAEFAQSFVRAGVCPVCDGSRFDSVRVKAYRYRGRTFSEWMRLSIDEWRRILNDIEASNDPIIGAALEKIRKACEALARSGLGHLSLDRTTSTLSGGELQRLKIALSLIVQLRDACYILDEPSLGLHAADNEALLENLRALRDAGNTVLLSDHDPDMIAACDHRLFLGPGSGELGGRIVKQAPAAPKLKRMHSRNRASGEIVLAGCNLHNIKNETIAFPLGQLVSITGVSGSGKSSFARGILEPAIGAYLAGGRTTGPHWKSLSGAEKLREVIVAGQAPVGRSRRSTLLTYLDIGGPLRTLFADSELARLRGYSASHFSTNRPEGRCPNCNGLGTLTDDTENADGGGVVCESCNGLGLREAVLDCRWNGLGPEHLLRSGAAHLLPYFKNAGPESVSRSLSLLVELGLGDMPLGRTLPGLSGGEAQRLKLVRSLSTMHTDASGVLFILDEPTAGLYASDIQKLLNEIERLLAGGKNSVVVIEHHLEWIASSDFVIDFGPGSGARGGRVVAKGAPSKLGNAKESLTARALARKPARAKASSRPPSTQRKNIAESGVAVSLDDVTRFQGLLRGRFAFEDRSDSVADTEEELLQRAHANESVQPAYFLGGSHARFPSGKDTVLQALRIEDRLDRAIAPFLNYVPENATIEFVDSKSRAKAIEGGTNRNESPRFGWTLATELCARGTATRTALGELLEHAAEAGWEAWTDQRCEIHQIQDREALRTSVPAAVTVLLPAKVSGRAAIDQVLRAGNGWGRVFKQDGATRLTLLRDIVNRPVSPSRGEAGARAAAAGLFARSGRAFCPFCEGSGVREMVPEDLLTARAGAKSKLSPGDAAFYTPGAQALFAPVLARWKRTFQFFAAEGLPDLFSPSTEWERLILWHGYPRAKFPVPGRKTQKQIDYYEWQGLHSYTLARLHLTKNAAWKKKVEAGLKTRNCPACAGTGLDWPTRQLQLKNETLPDFLKRATIADLQKRIAAGLPKEEVLRFVLEDLVKQGLGSVGVQTRCDGLNATQRKNLSEVARRRLGFAGAGYCVD